MKTQKELFQIAKGDIEKQVACMSDDCVKTAIKTLGHKLGRNSKTAATERRVILMNILLGVRDRIV